MEIEEELSICIKCVDDECLKNIIFEKDEMHNCSQCNEINLAIQFVDLAKLLETVITKNFTKGTYQKYFNKDRGFSEEFQRGVPLQEVIDEILGLEVTHGNELVQLLVESESSSIDPNDYDDLEGGLFTDDENYVELQIDNLNLIGQWYQLIEELKTQKRFFSDTARKLFKFLFEDLDKLWSYIPVENKNDKGWFSREKRNVIETLPICTKIYRARRANSLSECERFLLNPNQELAPPPTEYAQQGRMNAKGISNFYGAFDIDTCISEMRPSIGSFIVVGEFETTRELKILNFEYLENSYGHISYFLSDYQDQSSRRKFLKKLHKLISAPIIIGHEDEYLITQVLAEYLAYMHPQNFDGISFKSTQSEKGSNIVLFPKVTPNIEKYSFDFNYESFFKDAVSIKDKIPESKEELYKFNIKFVPDSSSLHQTKKVAYTSIKKEFHFTERSGKQVISLFNEQIDEQY